MSYSTSEYRPTYHDSLVNFTGPTSSGKASIHWIEAGPSTNDAPTIVLYHGFPSSSNQFRDFIPLLSSEYRVLALDFPGFGLTTVPDGFVYTFENIAAITSAWLDEVKLDKYMMYVFDYGAPIGLRVALQHPERVQAIITQNGNAYVEGFGHEFWAPIRQVWKTENSGEARKDVAAAYLTLEGTKYQYTAGVPEKDAAFCNPEAWHFDFLQNVSGPENQRHQLDLFYDYRTNVPLYPEFQAYFKKSGVPILAVWGKNDPCFIYPGAEKFEELPNAKVHLLDAGHFALETKRWEIASIVRTWISELKL